MAKRKFADGFDKQMLDPELRYQFNLELQRQLTMQAILNELDLARTKAEITKAELSAQTSLDAVTVRRLLTSPKANPRLSTLVELAMAMNLELALVPRRTAL